MARDATVPGTAEAIASTAVQAVGTLLSIAALVAVLIVATDRGEPVAIASSAIYGATLILAFLASTLYSGAKYHPRFAGGPIARALRTADHCAIYLLIAGTYTPIAMMVLPPGDGRLLTLIVWVVALTGAVLRIAAPNSLLKVRIGLYLLLGWLVVAWGNSMVDGLGTEGSLLLAAGGLAYTTGIAVYLRRSLPYREAIWHVFVIAGTACFFTVIVFYALPGG